MQISFKQASPGNYRAASRAGTDIRYLVIHYTANNGDTAKNNADYFSHTEVSASAHYFVDENTVWQSVHDHDIAWHCGTNGTYYHPYCRNSNSIGIEMCSRKKDGKFYFSSATVDRAVLLARALMKQYDIPADRVVRHYDVTHKNCPAPFVEDASAWSAFRARLSALTPLVQQKKEEDEMTIYKTQADVPEWGKATVAKLLQKGYLSGESKEELNLEHYMLRALVVNDRAGLYGE